MALAARARPLVEHHPRRRAVLPPMSLSRTPKLQGAILTCVRTDSLAPASFQAGNQVVAHTEETMEERDKVGKKEGQRTNGR